MKTVPNRLDNLVVHILVGCKMGNNFGDLGGVSQVKSTHEIFPCKLDYVTHLPVCLQQVVEFVKGEDYVKFTRIVFDTAPTGHTLRLLSVPDFVDAALGKIVRLRKKLGSAGDAVRGLFGASDQQDTAVEKLEKLRVSALSLKWGAGRWEWEAAGAPKARSILESRPRWTSGLGSWLCGCS
jgi:hypothetical protein